MRSLFVMDPLLSVNPHKDTTFSFLEQSQARGHQNLVCGVNDVWASLGKGYARAQEAKVTRPTHAGEPHAVLGPWLQMCFDDVDVIWMRKDPPVDDAYLFACMVLDLAKRERTLVVNDPRNLRVVHEKMWALWATELTPATLVSSNPVHLVDFVKERGVGVLKPLHLMGGMGVFAFEAGDKNLRSAADLLTLEGKRLAIAQEFLPAVRQGDKRVLLMDGEPIGAVLRVPRGDDVRSNLHVGGSAQRAVIDEHDRNIAAVVGPMLKELGMLFVGLDVIGGKLTEVNVTSPTGAQEIDALDERTGKDTVAAHVLDAVEQKLAAR